MDLQGFLRQTLESCGERIDLCPQNSSSSSVDLARDDNNFHTAQRALHSLLVAADAKGTSVITSIQRWKSKG